MQQVFWFLWKVLFSFSWTIWIIFLLFIRKIASSCCEYTNYCNINRVEIWFVVSINVHSISLFRIIINEISFVSFSANGTNGCIHSLLGISIPHFSAWYSGEFIRSPRAFWPLKTSKLRDSVKEDLLMLFSRWKWAVIIRAVRNYERYYYIIRVLKGNSFPLCFHNLYKKILKYRGTL